MKSMTPREFVAKAEEAQGLAPGSFEKSYTKIRRRENKKPVRNLPMKPVRFFVRPVQGELDQKRIQFK
jgi:hypothetical protein